jgi:hypothetical protein
MTSRIASMPAMTPRQDSLEGEDAGGVKPPEPGREPIRVLLAALRRPWSAPPGSRTGHDPFARYPVSRAAHDGMRHRLCISRRRARLGRTASLCVATRSGSDCRRRRRRPKARPKGAAAPLPLEGAMGRMWPGLAATPGSRGLWAPGRSAIGGSRRPRASVPAAISWTERWRVSSCEWLRGCRGAG